MLWHCSKFSINLNLGPLLVPLIDTRRGIRRCRHNTWRSFHAPVCARAPGNATGDAGITLCIACKLTNDVLDLSWFPKAIDVRSAHDLLPPKTAGCKHTFYNWPLAYGHPQSPISCHAKNCMGPTGKPWMCAGNGTYTLMAVCVATLPSTLKRGKYRIVCSLHQCISRIVCS